MPVRKRGGHWYVRLALGGQRIERAVGKGATKKEALALEARIRADHLAGRLGVAPKRLVTDALVRWLDNEARTLKSHGSLLSKVGLIAPHCAGRPLSQIVDVAASVKSAGIRDGLKPATINRRLAILRRVANLAHAEWGWLNEPLGERIKLLPGEKSRTHYLTPAQAKRLLDACEHHGVATAILVALTTGLRQADILRLTDANRHDGLLILDAETKSGRPLSVPDPGVPLPIGISYATLRTYFERARTAAGLPHIRFHDLRHTTASWLLQQGQSLLMVRDLLGHSSLAVTSKYAHLAPLGIKDAGKLLRKTAPFLPHFDEENGEKQLKRDANRPARKQVKAQGNQ